MPRPAELRSAENAGHERSVITASNRAFLVALLSFALCACGPTGPIRDISLVGVVAGTEIIDDTGSNARVVTFTDGRTFLYDARLMGPADSHADPLAGNLFLYGEGPDGPWHTLLPELDPGCWGQASPAEVRGTSS